MSRTEIRITGFGGQGVVLSGYIIGRACSINAALLVISLVSLKTSLSSLTFSFLVIYSLFYLILFSS